MTEKDKKLFELQRKVEELEERIAIMSEGLVHCDECVHHRHDGYCDELHLCTVGGWYCGSAERKDNG